MPVHFINPQDDSTQTDVSETMRKQPEKVFLQRTGDWEPGSVLMNMYQVRSILGKGGMGTVYLMELLNTSAIRFAVKTLNSRHLSHPERRKQFITELRTWIDLPEHPNIVKCCFFRSIEHRLGIFLEYVNGSSLTEIIRGQKCDLRQILDMAVQIAWGLEAAHRRGVVHQDVKPGNILITQDGTAKITDFGLAKSWLPVSEELDTEEDNRLMTSRGMTAAYCSPEQSNSGKINRKTDIWSLGVTMLEMLLGGRVWQYGFLADSVLDHSFFTGGLTDIPENIITIVQGCLQPEPRDRWQDMDTLARRLIDAYCQLAGSNYFRDQPVIPDENTASQEDQERITLTGNSWNDPLNQLEQACETAGVDIQRIYPIMPDRRGSKTSQILVDLELIEQAIQLYISKPSIINLNNLKEFVDLNDQKSVILQKMNDLPGALAIQERLLIFLKPFPPDSHPAGVLLSRVYNNLGLFNWELGNLEMALSWFDEADQIINENPNKHLDSNNGFNAALIRMNQGVILNQLGRFQESEEKLTHAVTAMELLIQKDISGDVSGSLIIAYTNLGNVLCDQQQPLEAITYYEKATTTIDRLEVLSRFKNMDYERALIHVNLAGAFNDLEKQNEAVAHYSKAKVILEELLYQRSKNEAAGYLAVVYANLANALINQDHDEAIKLIGNAVNLTEQALHRNWSIELRTDLALYKAQRLCMMVKLQPGTVQMEQLNAVISDLRTEYDRTGRADIKGWLRLICQVDLTQLQ